MTPTQALTLIAAGGVILLARPVADWLIFKLPYWFPRTSRFTSRRGASPRLPEHVASAPASFSGE